MCLAIENFVLFFDNTFSFLLQMMFFKNSRFNSPFENFEKKKVEGSNWITIWFNMVLTQWFNLILSVSVVKKLLSISPFVMKVPFVALKLILSNSFCMVTWLKLVFSEIPFCTYCFIYACALSCHFSWSIYTKKGYYSRNCFN